jgi:hypothetical protein
MARTQPLDLSQFERLHGEKPLKVLDRHPDGRYVALQVIALLHTTAERAAVWDLETKRIVWAPEGVSAIAWLPGGDRVALINEQYQPAPDHPAIIVSPLQSEFTYSFMIASWPEHKPQTHCLLKLPTGWPIDLAVSPRGDLAAVVWQDQGEAGLEFVAFEGDTPRQIAETGLPQVGSLGGFLNFGGFPLKTQLVFHPVFSPDGRYILVPWQANEDWWDIAMPNGMKASDTSREFQIGTISILDWDERTHQAIPLIERIPAGWISEARDDGWYFLLIEPPVFLDAERFTITLPTGAVRKFSVVEMTP